MNDLVSRLTEGPQRVIVGGPSPTAEEFGKRVTEIGYAFIKFPDTRGGTDLGVKVDQTATRLNHADFDSGEGRVHVEGTLTLDFVDVRCVADIDLATLSGTGQLVRA